MAPNPQVLPDGTTVAGQLLDDVRVMLAHALNTGRHVSPSWVDTVARAERDGVTEATLRRLATVHDGLCSLIAPATPRSLHYLESVRGATRGRRGIPLVRLLTGLAVLFLTSFVILATREDVSSANADFENVLAPMTLFVNLLFLISSAGMGATFAGLFAVNKHLNDFSYDPRYASSYWVRILLGVTAGLILAELAPFGDESELGRPLLALLGGFGVEVVYRLLQRLVDVAASLVTAAPSAGDAAAAESARSQQREGRVRLDVARQLAKLRAGVETKDPAALATELDALIAEIAGTDTPDAGDAETEETPFSPAVVAEGESPFAPGQPVADAPDAPVETDAETPPVDLTAGPPPDYLEQAAAEVADVPRRRAPRKRV